MNKISFKDSHALKIFVEIIKGYKPKEYLRKVYRERNRSIDGKEFESTYNAFSKLLNANKDFTLTNKARLENDLGLSLEEIWEPFEGKIINRSSGSGNVSISQRDGGTVIADHIGPGSFSSNEWMELVKERDDWKKRYFEMQERYFKCIDKDT